MNVAQGSVTVTAGGAQLVENVDYTVDYTLGRVTILNEGILNSGTPINISLESNSGFSAIRKTFRWYDQNTFYCTLPIRNCNYVEVG